jgi:tetratricopeptide (TPR) repeat protein
VSTLYCKIGNLEEASKNISKAIDLSPQEANNYFMRSLIHWLRGNIILARRDCDDAIRLWPSQQPPANLHLVRGLTWLSESYGARMALHDFRQAVKLGGKGNTSNYMFWQFVARQKSGLDLIEDQDQIMAAIESEKDLALKTRIHARLAALNGDIDIARQAYQQFLAENSQNRWLMLVEQASLRCLASIYPERLDLRSLAEWWDGVNPSKWTTG